MDYGTGSGVLSIAALLLGAAEAVGTDVDSLAVKAANRNAELNGRLQGWQGWGRVWPGLRRRSRLAAGWRL